MNKIMKNKEENKENKPFVSVAELAKMLGISHVAIFKKIKKGQIEAQKVGRSYIISAEEVNSILNTKSGELTSDKKMEIEKAVQKVVAEYGDTLKLLGKE
jgi:excisionase family DNA binding protein